jgi:hypothetical protein
MHQSAILTVLRMLVGSATLKTVGYLAAQVVGRYWMADPVEEGDISLPASSEWRG